MSYIRFYKEKKTAKAIQIVPSQECAVFAENAIDAAIVKTKHMLRHLRELKTDSITHRSLHHREATIKDLKEMGLSFEIKNIPYKVC